MASRLITQVTKAFEAQRRVGTIDVVWVHPEDLQYLKKEPVFLTQDRPELPSYKGILFGSSVYTSAWTPRGHIRLQCEDGANGTHWIDFMGLSRSPSVRNRFDRCDPLGGEFE